MPYIVKGPNAVEVDGVRFPPGEHDDPRLEKARSLFPEQVERVERGAGGGKTTGGKTAGKGEGEVTDGK